MPSYVAVQNSPAVMSNYEETIQDSKGEARHGEEIPSPRWLRDDFAGRLASAGLVPGSSGALVTQRETVRSEPSKTEFEQFTMNTRSAPGGILGNHAEN